LAAELAKAGEHPEVILEATYGWVRYEAPCDRAGCEAPPAACRNRSLKAGGSLTSEVRGRVGAALTTPGRVGTSRRPGFGKQDLEVYECRNQWWNPLKKMDRLGIWRMAGMALR
jgi:hypothetical protein